MKQVILASNSPRRREILSLSGMDFLVDAADVDEDIPVDDPAKLVRKLSHRKAEAIAHRHADSVIIGADTVVAVDLSDGGESQILGKPADEKAAFDMLRLLSGRTHQVHTGVTIISTDGDGRIVDKRTFSETTEVTFYPLSDDEIRSYILTGEPMDKAGAYGIQGRGALLVKKIDGDYLNVVGLPLSRLWREFALMR